MLKNKESFFRKSEKNSNLPEVSNTKFYRKNTVNESKKI